MKGDGTGYLVDDEDVAELEAKINHAPFDPEDFAAQLWIAINDHDCTVTGAEVTKAAAALCPCGRHQP